MTVNQGDYIDPSNTRLFIQVVGSPGEAYQYIGCGEVSESGRSPGEREPILCQSRRQRGKFDFIGQKITPPELDTLTIRTYLPRASYHYLETLARTRCLVNLQEVFGECSQPEEFNAKWVSKTLWEGVSLGELTRTASGNFMGENTDPVMLEGSMQANITDRFFDMLFSERAGDEVLAEVLDGTFAGAAECGNCGPYSEGCDHFYAITRANAGSPGLSGQLVYTNDGVNFTAVDIPTLGGLDPNKIAEVGDFLIVISEAAGNHQYVRRQAVIGAGDWVEVTTGYVAFHGPRAIYVKSPGEVFIAGAAGYIYKSTDYQSSVSVIEAGVLTAEDFNAIHGDGDRVIIAVGDNNTILRSSNGGETFEVVTGPLAGSDLQTVWVINEYIWIVGGDGGAFYYTDDGGVTFTAIPFVGTGVGAIIHDVKASEMAYSSMYATIEIGGRGYVYRSTDYGVHWYTDQGIDGLGNNARLNFVAPCPNNINVVGTGGLAAAGTDGYLAIAE